MRSFVYVIQCENTSSQPSESAKEISSKQSSSKIKPTILLDLISQENGRP